MSDNKISRTILQYKDLETLQQYAEAQNTTILNLSKKIQKYEEQVKHLEDLLKNTVPIISSSPNGVNQLAEEDAEYICNIEIAKLKERSLVDVLTLEESRRLETYFKILTTINTKNKGQEKDAQKLPTDKLLELVESKNDSGTK